MILDPALNLARKSALASVGAVALTGDTLAGTFERLAARGARVERAAREKLRTTAADARADVAERKEQIVAENKDRIAEARGVFEQMRDRLIDILHLPTQTAVEQLNGEVARLSAQIDKLRAAARRQPRAAAQAPAVSEPTPGYEKLNAERVNEMLPTLSEPTLLAVRDYEQTHSNRVTVLRAIDRLTEGKAEA